VPPKKLLIGRLMSCRLISAQDNSLDHPRSAFALVHCLLLKNLTGSHLRASLNSNQ
jgi:hypothetical protein